MPFRKLSHSFFIHTARKAALILTLFMPQWKGAHSRTAVLDQNKVESAAVFGFSWDSNSRQLAGHLSLFQLSISMFFFLKKKGRPLWWCVANVLSQRSHKTFPAWCDKSKLVFVKKIENGLWNLLVYFNSLHAFLQYRRTAQWKGLY